MRARLVRGIAASRYRWLLPALLAAVAGVIVHFAAIPVLQVY